MIRVLIAATSEIMCAGLEALLAGSPMLVVVGRWQGTVGLAPQVEFRQPDVVLLELESPDDDTLAMLEALVADPHAPALVVLTDDPYGTWAAGLLLIPSSDVLFTLIERLPGLTPRESWIARMLIWS